MRHWASYADSNYLGRLKALHASMIRHCGEFKLHVLAWDDAVMSWAQSAANAEAVSLREFLVRHRELRPENLPGPPRSRVEQMWTAGPAWVSDVFHDAESPVTYVDADVMFHSSPEPMFNEIGDAAAGVIPHGFCETAPPPIPTRATHEIFGKYNVGIVHFGDSLPANVWEQRVRLWCYDKITHHPYDPTGHEVRYADQRYLDTWPEAFGAHVVQHPGACAGPWGVHAKPLEVCNGVIHFGGRPLIAWHYSGYRELPEGHTVLTRPEYMLTDEQAEILYRPYIRALREVE